MLNLKELEEKFDNALAAETEESLTNWLQEKRLGSYLESLGQGILEDLSHFSNSGIISEANSTSFDTEYFEIPTSQDYLIAA